MARIINKSHFARLNGLLQKTKGTMFHGGKDIDENELFIEPTVVTDIKLDDVLLEDEIFGPILPVITYNTLEDARAKIHQIDEHPLGGYIMSEDQTEIHWVLENLRCGDISVNGMSILFLADRSHHPDGMLTNY
jgi:aldehyde dehydrogenase (NAD+)